MHLIFCTIFSIFSTLWPLAWPFAMQISLLLFKIGGESCTLYTIVGFVFQLNFLQDLMLDMKMGSWLGIKICLVMLELDSWCTSFDTFFGTKISNVSNSLYNTSTYIHNAQGRPSSQCHHAMALVVFLPRPENQGKIWVPSNKKSLSPEVALVDFSTNGRPW